MHTKGTWDIFKLSIFMISTQKAYVYKKQTISLHIIFIIYFILIKKKLRAVEVCTI